MPRKTEIEGDLMAPIMKPSLVLLIALLWLVASGLAHGAEPPPAARDTPQGEIYHAVARVIQDYKDPYSFAQLEPAPFTIPEGYVATKLIYRWVDPKTDHKSDRLTADSIYSVTLGKYVTDAKNNPDIVLPAGDYKLVCGGMAGATGVLGYTLIRADLVDETDEVVKTPPKTRSDVVQAPPKNPKEQNGNPNKPPIPSVSNRPAVIDPDSEISAANMKALEGRWSGVYTIEKITGDVGGLGIVPGKRAFSIDVKRDATGVQVNGNVWLPPGRFGRAQAMTVQGNSVWFSVTGQYMASKTLVVYFDNDDEAVNGVMSGKLTGYLPKGETSEEVFRGSWKLTRQ